MALVKRGMPLLKAGPVISHVMGLTQPEIGLLGRSHRINTVLIPSDRLDRSILAQGAVKWTPTGFIGQGTGNRKAPFSSTMNGDVAGILSNPIAIAFPGESSRERGSDSTASLLGNRSPFSGQRVLQYDVGAAHRIVLSNHVGPRNSRLHSTARLTNLSLLFFGMSMAFVRLAQVLNPLRITLRICGSRHTRSISTLAKGVANG